MRTRRLVLFVGSLLLGLTCAWAPAAGAAPAGDAPVTTLGSQPEGGGIIPRPDSGVEPEDAGDRGGALQTVLFVVVLGGVAVIGGLVVRESRRARAERGF
ncbi:hypothetical protein [Actinospongicola halichondriae]|uniref:hypothetical protein n=1 Tax=Actinospongicola halichondriae TaxID=3236844 RepID=UPI003D58A828